MKIMIGDAVSTLASLPDQSVQCCVTSPPYFGLRSYLPDDHPDKSLEIGMEPTPQEYVARLVAVFREVRRVLRDDGTCWVNLGSSYASSTSHQTLSRRMKRAPACGSDDKESQDSQDADRACPDFCDGLRSENQSHHDRTAHNVQCVEQDAPLLSRIARDNVRSDCAALSLDVSLPDAQASTIPLSSSQLPVFSAREVEVSACRPSLGTCAPDAQASAHTESNTSGMSPTLRPLVVRTEGKESFFSACGRSDCKGVGRCGLCWCSLAIPSLNIKSKDLISIPQLVAFALQADGWWLRQDIIWAKPNPMPESVTDRCTKSHEYLFLLAKSERYYFDAAAISEESVKGAAGSSFNTGKTSVHQMGRSSDKERVEGGRRNRRSVWTVATKPCSDAHFAVMPDALVEPCILAGSRSGDTVLDPFFGSGTVGRVAERLGRDWIGIDLNPAYLSIQQKRTAQAGLCL